MLQRNNIVFPDENPGLRCQYSSSNVEKRLIKKTSKDNINHNPTATTAQSSFRGTNISVFQHPSHENLGETRGSLKLDEGKAKESS